MVLYLQNFGRFALFQTDVPMVRKIKSRLKKFILLSLGSYDHLKGGVTARKVWYGNDYGGFFLCLDNLTARSVIYSVGIGEDISFDLSVINKHKCMVYGFDPTPRSIQWIRSHKGEIPKNFRFYNYGLSDKSGLVNFFLPKILNPCSFN